MSLQEAIKEMQEELEKKKKEEEAEGTEETQEAEEEIQEEQKEEAEAAPAEEKAPEEPKKEEPKVEAVPVVEEKLDNSAYARMRREAAASKKKAESEEARRIELEQRLSRLESGVIDTVETPAAVTVDAEMEEVRQRLRMEKAEREFERLEGEFKRNTTDYDAVSKEYNLALAQSIKNLNPRMSNSELYEEFKKTILTKAANYLKDGYDPIEELYHEAKSLGYTGQSMNQAEAKEEPKVEEEVKPDMKKVAANRARSTGMTGANGRSQGQMTLAAAADLPSGEWVKLPFAEKQRLMYGPR